MPRLLCKFRVLFNPLITDAAPPHKDHQNCIGWVRTGDKIHDGIAVVVCNGDGEGLKHMAVGGDKAGQVWTDLLNWSQEEVTIGEDGWADFKCPAKSLSIWAAKDAKFRNEFGQKA